MKYWTNDKEFDDQMLRFRTILEDKGYVIESDHPYAYQMQNDDAFDDIKEWLIEKGYEGKVESLCNRGYFKLVAVYGLFDTELFSYEEINKILEREADRQNNKLDF
ncbi:hypothetical protein [Streptococcus orisasini]|uniref:hypothetical protein n=1 Tax=Streptococcus orisasini TaxID=1080071 RepID=UPI00070DAFD2|nr:hypothetical protein [Streptococcus orisasini]